VPVLFVECQAPAAIVEQRLQQRERAGHSASDATSEIAQKEREIFPPFNDLPEQGHVIINTEGDVEAALSHIDEQLTRANRAGT
jgi:predicted kinase